MKIGIYASFGLITVLLATSVAAPQATLSASERRAPATTRQSESYTPDANLSTCPAGISYGETIDCSIVSDETDSYSFSGTASDRVIARLQVTSGNLDPTLEIDAPGGGQLCTSSTIFNLLELNCTLTSSGTHTVHVSGSAGQTGGYNLHLQRSNDPANQGAIAYGQTMTGNITVAPEMDVYLVDMEVTAGDMLVAHLEVLSPGLDPHLRIYHLDGTLLCEDSTIFDDLELSCNVTTSGMYTVFALGGDNQTGSYEICVHNRTTSCGYQAFLPVVIR